MNQEKVEKLTSEVKRYKELLDKKKGEEQRLLGHKDSLMLKLKELGFSTVNEGELYLEELSNTIDSKTYEAEEKKKEFVRKYGDYLL
jgi:hypothetical protein